MSEQMDYAAFSSRYKDREYVGSGGFAKVYKVFDHAKNHYVALKIADVRPEHKQFTLQREVELVNQLEHHRNIARYDACYRFNTGITGEIDFAVLKFYEYGNLEQFLNREDITDEDKKIIIKGILRGTAYLHLNDITHRDLKAQNILLNREDGVWVPKIIDFGLARQFEGSQTITNSSIGLSYAYAAPEQIQNKRIQKNVDIWAVGVIIYRIIAGELPFRSNSKGDQRSTQSQLDLSRRIINLELPDKLDTLAEPYQSIIKRCLVLEPKERAQSAEELIDILAGKDIVKPTPLPHFVPVNPPQPSPSVPVTDETVIMPPPDPSIAQPVSGYQLTPPGPGAGYVPAATSGPKPVQPEIPVSTPPVTPPPPTGYGTLRDNHTQIVGNIPIPESLTPPPTPPTKVSGPKGGEKSKFNWAYLLLPLLLAVAGYTAYQSDWFVGKETSAIPQKTNPGVIQLTPNVLTYEKESVSTDNARSNPAELDRLFADLEAKLSASPDQYRLYFIAAKNRVYRKDYDAVSGLLQLARDKAKVVAQTDKLKNEMDAVRESIAIRRYVAQGGEW